MALLLWLAFSPFSLLHSSWFPTQGPNLSCPAPNISKNLARCLLLRHCENGGSSGGTYSSDVNDGHANSYKDDVL